VYAFVCSYRGERTYGSVAWFAIAYTRDVGVRLGSSDGRPVAHGSEVPEIFIAFARKVILAVKCLLLLTCTAICPPSLVSLNKFGEVVGLLCEPNELVFEQLLG
jgi:hypothetical protein